MTEIRIEHILIIIIIVIILYYLMDKCNCRGNGFRVGIQERPCNPGGCSWNNCQSCNTGWCSESVQNCIGCTGGKWCGTRPPAPPPAPAPCPKPCSVVYKLCPKPAINQGVIEHIKSTLTFIKVVYISAWEVQGTYKEWLNHFTKLVTAGYNVLIISFIPQQNLNLNIPNWDILTCDEKTRLKNYLISKNSVLLLSIGGGAAPPPTLLPGSSGNCTYEKRADGSWKLPCNTCNNCCNFNWIDLLDGTDNYVAKYAYNQMFDGIDFDLEWFSSGNAIKGCSDKLAQQATTIRTYYKSKGKIPIITSAPQSPYFTKNSWVIDYVQLEVDHPTSFDFYNIQFYNNNNGNTYDSTIGSEDKPNTALYMVKRGIPSIKIVLGKCGKGGNCCLSEFYVDSKDLKIWALQHDFKGIMYWSYLGGCTPEATDWLTGLDTSHTYDRS